MTISWNITPEESWGALAQRQADSIEADIVSLVESLLDDVQSWMRANHRWQNVTGEAEAALYTDIEHVVRQSVHLLMSHGPAIAYAMILELNPKTALLGDAVDHWQPLLFRGVQEIVRRHSS